MLSILIPEKIPAHNKGEEAILLGICKTLECLDEEFKIYLYSESPEYDGKCYYGKAEIITNSMIPETTLPKKEKLAHLLKSGIKHLMFWACPQSLRGLLFKDRLWALYSEVDLVILGHDNAFSFAHNFLILFCKLLKKKVVMYGASILPHVYEKQIPRIFTKYCLEKLDLITLREPISKGFLEKIGLVSENLHVTADKAFLLEPIEKDKALKILEENNIVPDESPLIGMTVVYGSGVFKRGLLEYKDPEKKYAAYVDAMAKVVDFMIEKFGGKVVFMPHTIGPEKSDDDRVVSHDVYKKVKNKEGVYLIDGDYGASELKGMIACCDFFVGARTHSVIAATSMGVPSVVLSYPKDFRTYGIVGDMLGQKRWVYNIEYLKDKDLIELIQDAWDERDKTKQQLLDNVDDMKKRSLSNGVLLKNTLNKNG